MLACSASHTGEFNPARSRIRVENESISGESIINVCRACKKPSCVSACRYGACKRNEKLGVIQIDYDLCVGCYACVDACPFHADFIDPVKKIPIICDGCNGDPACVKFCYKEAIKVVI